jgi:hypothetical protein
MLIRKLLLTSLLLLMCHSVAFAGIIRLYNTGVLNDAGDLLAGGAVDPHFVLTTSADPIFAGPAAFVIDGTAYPMDTWLPDNGVSKWIAPRADLGIDPSQSLPEGWYIYRTTFTLPQGFKSAEITGQWASDNGGVMFLNGAFVQGTGWIGTSFNVWQPFTIMGGFIEGENVIEYYVQNVNGTNINPSGLRVEMAGTVEEVPEPGTLILVGLGLMGAGAIRLRKRTSSQ